MQYKTRAVVMLILLVGLPVVVVLAVGAFISKDLRFGLFYALGGACVAVTSSLALARRPRLLQILTYDVVAYALWSLILYHSRLRPHHILLVSVIGVPVGLALALLIYGLWKSHMREGVILYDDSPRKVLCQLLFVNVGSLVFLLVLIFGSTRTIFLDLLWLFISAAFACFFYLAVAIFLLERKTGQKIRHDYSATVIPRTLMFTSVTSMAFFLTLIEILWGRY